jgi:2-phospho-L-lactate guanylyltransferase
VALIPVKDLPKAKARLASALDENGRRELATALFRDVLAAALDCPALDQVAVVTRDPVALQIASDAGAEGMDDAGNLNESLDSVARTLGQRSVDRLLVLHADLPLVSAADIETVARSSADVALVSSGDGGTNALACPTRAFGFCYGVGSAQAHKEAAWDADLEAELLDLPGLALDIDTPADLERLQHLIESGQAAGEHTLAALRSIGLVSDSRRIHQS